MSSFVTHRKYRYWRPPTLAGSVAGAEPALAAPPPLQRPARFVVALDLVSIRGSIIPEHVPEHAYQGPAFDPAVYVGRVEEIAESGEITARVWEVPNGQESIATLTRDDVRGQPVRAGASLRIWTWLELSAGPDCEPETHIHVDVLNKILNAEERAQLEQLLAKLGGDTSTTP